MRKSIDPQRRAALLSSRSQGSPRASAALRIEIEEKIAPALVDQPIA